MNFTDVMLILNALGIITLCILHIDTMKTLWEIISKLNELNNK